MATVKVACPKCGQKVSGDESFFGTTVECPICSADILFPGERRSSPDPKISSPERDSDSRTPSPAYGEFPASHVPEAPPQAAQETENDEPDTASSGRSRTNDISPERVPQATRTNTAPANSADRGNPAEARESTPTPLFGAISMICAVLAVVTCVFGILFCPPAIVFGHLSQSRAHRSTTQPAPGQALGAFGMLIGYVWLFVTILILALAVLFKEPLGEFRELIQSRR